MALGRPTRRQNHLGRDRSRPGSSREQRASAAAGGPTTPVVPVAAPPERRAKGGHGFGLTRRALALVAVLAVLGLSYARSLTLYLSQQHEIEATQAANDERQARIDELEDEVTRWSDPDYVRAQARARLGWVMPGEIGYRVIGPDGVVIGADTTPVEEPSQGETGPWYEQVWAQVKSADLPQTNAEAIPDDEDVVVTPETEDTPG